VNTFEGVVRRWPSAGSELTYDIGSEFYGETHARLGGDGSYRLWSTVTQDRTRLDYEGLCDPDEVVAVVAAMQRHAVWQVSHVRPLQGEDDALVRIAVKDERGSDQVELWISEVGDVPEFERAQEPLLALIRTLSGGAILETGR
jgi:hypothetical protein